MTSSTRLAEQPSGSDWQLRVAVAGDAPSIASLDAQTGAVGWSQASWDDEMARMAVIGEMARTWLVAESGRIVGFAGVAHMAGVAHVLGVAVEPDWRRRGLARSLLQELAGLSQRAGSATMTLEVRASNAPARQLYRQVGFVEEGVRPGYYADGEDAVIAWMR